MKKISLWATTMFLFILPSLVWANTQVHVSDWVGPIIRIAFIVAVAIFLCWALGYWGKEIPPPIGKLLYFAVVVIAVILIVVALLHLVGISIT